VSTNPVEIHIKCSSVRRIVNVLNHRLVRKSIVNYRNQAFINRSIVVGFGRNKSVSLFNENFLKKRRNVVKMVVERITVNSAFFNNFLDCNFIQRLFIQERNKCRLDSRLGKCRHSVPPENCKTSVCRRIFPFRIFSYTIYAADCYTN